MKNNIILKMPKTESDRNDGINDGNIETYKNNPMLSLTKEELQNSTDSAQLDEYGNPKKVLVEFSDFDLERDDFPDREKTIEVLNDEKEYWGQYLKNDKKTIVFLSNAIEILSRPLIRCIRISDFNTFGLTGVHKKMTPWNNLVKNRGVSDKPGNQGGSFGVGKDAAFACSKVRIVFYNTINIDGEKAFQGVIKLPSYEKNYTNYDGMGFYSLNDGESKALPILESCSLEKDFKRDLMNIGMDKFIIGFDETISKDNLKDAIIVSSLDNFLYAFMNNTLEVRYDDIIVDANHLSELVEKYKNREPKEIRLNRLTAEYYETLKKPDKDIYISIFEENDIYIAAKLNPDGSRRTAIIRQSGMKVFDKDRINNHFGFSAVVVLKGNRANEYFKKLENTEHTKWSIERAENQKDAKKKMSEVYDAVKNLISSLHEDNYDTVIDADGVNEFLPYAYITGKKEKTENLSNEIKERTRAKKNNKSKREIVTDLEIEYVMDNNGEVTEHIVNHGNSKSGTVLNPVHISTTPSIGPNGEETQFSEEKNGQFKFKKRIPIDNFDFKLLHYNNKYILKFKSKADIKSGFLELMISGEQDAIAIGVQQARLNNHDAPILDNKIRLENVQKDILNVVEFRLKNDEEWALEVNVNESEK